MGLVGYTVKLEQWEEEDRQLAAAGIPNTYDAYPENHSKNWLRARSMHVQNLQEWQGRGSMM
jgi:hypothetical protein